MLSVLEEVLERSQSLQRKKAEPQLNILAGLLKETEEGYPDIAEFPENQLIAFEKETIGFYISRHPLARYQEEIERITRVDTSALSTLQSGDEIKICGLVSGLKEINTKKGDRMAFLNLEDMKGFVEVILFPEVFKAALPHLRGGDPIIVRGILELSEDHVKIRGLEVKPLSEASSSLPPKPVHLTIPLSSLTQSRLADLKKIITNSDPRLLLHFADEDPGRP
jgi:DNA polymerase-3 subunit alpha